MADTKTYPEPEAGTDTPSAPVSGISPKLEATDVDSAASEPVAAASSNEFDTIVGGNPAASSRDASEEGASTRDDDSSGESDVNTASATEATGNATPERDVLHFPSDPDAEADSDTNDEEKRRRASMPPEEILFQRQFCIRAKGSDCNRCELACPVGAISIDGDGWPSVDQQVCTNCGICYGVCDAFTSSRVNMVDLRSRVRRMAGIDGIVYLTCRENIFSDTEPAANVLVVPCLAALPPEFITSVIADGVRLIVAGNLNYCDTCRIAGDRGALLYDYTFQTAEAWTGHPVEFVDEVPEQKDLVERINRESRRDAISGLLSVVGEVASGRYRNGLDDELDDFETMREEMHAYAWSAEDFDHPLNRAMRQPGKFKTMFPRRQFLLDAIEVSHAVADNVTIGISGTDSHKCQCHFDCINACITGARGIDDDDLLTFDARYCIGCGLCLDACKLEACYMQEISADDLGEERRVADEEQVQAMLGARAAAVGKDGRKLAVDADSIYGAVEPPSLW